MFGGVWCYWGGREGGEAMCINIHHTRIISKVHGRHEGVSKNAAGLDVVF